MKIIKTTRKYLHVRMTQEEYASANICLDVMEREIAYRKWFLANHHKVTGEDDYGAYESYWVNNETGNMVQSNVI